MVFPSFRRYLLDQHRFDQRPHERQVQQPFNQRRTFLRWFRCDQFSGRLSPAVFTRDSIDQADPARFVDRDGAAREHDLHRRADATNLNGTYRAAKTGMQTKLDLGQTDNALLICECNAIVEGHRKFETTTHRKAVQRRDSGAGQLLDPGEEFLPQSGYLVGPIRGVDGRELVDICAHDEAVVLSGVKHQPPWRLRVQAVRQFVQFHQDIARQHIGAGAGRIEPQPDNAVGVGFFGPVLHIACSL